MKTTIIIVLCLFSAASIAQIYKWVDDNGKVHFSDQKPEDTKTESVDLNINTYTHVTIDDSIFDVGKKVVMYSTEKCGYCIKAKNYFKKNKIAFIEYDIERDLQARRRFKKMGAKGVPVILLGKKRMNGFSEKRFEKIYKQ